MDPFQLWSSYTYNPQMEQLYIGAILTVLLSVSIFKDYIDDGTELIISSKQYTRWSRIMMKNLCLFTIICCASFLNLINVLLSFLIVHISGTDALSLLVSLFISTIILFVLFSSIATFFSMWLNKVWIFIINITLSLLIVIYGVVANFTLANPLKEMLNHGRSSTTLFFANPKNGNVRRAATVYNSMLIDDEMNPNLNFDTTNLTDPTNFYKDGNNFYINTTQSENAIYTYDKEIDYVKSHKTSNLTTYFNLSKQFQFMNNSFSLENKINENAGKIFGSSTDFEYNITNKFDTLDYDNGDENVYIVPQWSTFTYDANTFQNFFQWLMQNIFTSNSAFFFGSGFQNDSDKMVDMMSMLTNMFDSQNFQYFYTKGSMMKKMNNNFNFQNTCVLSEKEEETFSDMLKIIINLFTWSDNNVTNYNQLLKYDKVWPRLNFGSSNFLLNSANTDSVWNFSNVATQEYLNVINKLIASQPTSIYDIIHFFLIYGVKNSTNTDTDANTNPLKIKNDIDLMNEYGKFLIYIWNNCLTNNELAENNKSISSLEKELVTGSNILSIDKQNMNGRIIMPFYSSSWNKDWYEKYNEIFGSLDPSSSNFAYELASAFSSATSTNGLIYNSSSLYSSDLFGDNLNLGVSNSSVTINSSSHINRNTILIALLNFLSLDVTNDEIGYSSSIPNNQKLDDIYAYAKDWRRINTNVLNLNLSNMNFANYMNNMFQYKVEAKVHFAYFILLWASFTIVLTASIIYLYYRKDFK